MRISDWSSDVCSSDLRDRNQLAVEPGRGLGTNQLVERLWGQHVDGDRAILRPRRFIGGGAIEMIGRDDPGAVRFALDIAREPSHRLQAPHMRFGKSIGGGWIMPQM